MANQNIKGGIMFTLLIKNIIGNIVNIYNKATRKTKIRVSWFSLEKGGSYLSESMHTLHTNRTNLNSSYCNLSMSISIII